MSKKSSATQWLWATVVIAAAIAAGIVIWRKLPHESTPASTAVAVPPASSTAIASSGETLIRHPIEQVQPEPAGSSTVALPSLDNSDTSMVDSLKGLAGDGLSGLLLTDRVALRIVATLDALPRQDVASGILPLRTPTGSFLVDQANGTTTMSERNAERYAPYMRIVENVDTRAAVAWYVHNYPLFQAAYRELGYPHGYFNDRLVQVLDDLIDAPAPNGPIMLDKPKALYVFSDPGLQSLSVGQKLMVRLGPDNEAKLKAKLRDIRAALTGAHLPPK